MAQPTLGELLEEARAAALAPEQDMLRMLRKRTASATVLASAKSNYERAASAVGGALEILEAAKNGARADAGQDDED